MCSLCALPGTVRTSFPHPGPKPAPARAVPGPSNIPKPATAKAVKSVGSGVPKQAGGSGGGDTFKVKTFEEIMAEKRKAKLAATNGK